MGQARVVTRFAPSPTGSLHIGGARTALFNWLFSKRHGGAFRLRIEDTDRARSTQDAIDTIFDSLGWLGLDHDGAVVYQSQRSGRHRETAERLLSCGNAYRCYATEREIAIERDRARKENRPVLFQSPWRDKDLRKAPDRPFVVRLKAPRNGTVRIHDAVAGDVGWKADTIDDLVLLRSDGSPTYMLAVVVDDHDMGISHVIRGNDHLGNAGRQALIFRACGWDLPIFAHIPLIHGPDGKKLSKRHGAVGVAEYRESGFIPEAMRNYLARLGWSHGDDELFSTENAVKWFDLGSVGSSPSRFDSKKLDSVSAYHLRVADDDVLTEQLSEWLLETGRQPLLDNQRDTIRRAMPVLKQNAKRLPDILERATCLLYRPTPPGLGELSAELDLDLEEADELVELVRMHVILDDEFAGDPVVRIRGVAEGANVKPAKVFKLLRSVLSGAGVRNAPSVSDLVQLLGREECSARFERISGRIQTVN